jgi:recombinational DNA repair ATPase RecF
MGIDDFGLHLDETRQSRLREKLHQLGQVFLTTPLTPTLGGHAIHVSGGKLSQSASVSS